jgi:hypothetical protein
MVLTVSFVLSAVTGFLVTVASVMRSDITFVMRSDITFVMRRHHHPLDASIGASGPHDFAVRLAPFVNSALASTASRSHFRDDRETPLVWSRTA